MVDWGVGLEADLGSRGNGISRSCRTRLRIIATEIGARHIRNLPRSKELYDRRFRVNGWASHLRESGC